MKTLAIVISVLALTSIVAGSVLAAENGAEQKAQTTCPVMGGKIDTQYFADHDGKRVYFCCPACSKPFNEDPDKYIKKLEDAGVVLEKAPVPQTTCPVMGGEIDTQYFADHDGKRVYFCCPACSKPFNEDPDKYIKKLEDAGVTLAKTPVPQTVCPNSGKPIDKAYFADYDGKRVYFCGPGCVQAFKADPETYMKTLDEAGVALADTPAEVKTQTMCPIMTGNKINKKYFGDYDGKRVYFCCATCRRKFKQDPAKWVKKLEDQGITLEPTPGADE